MTACNDSHSCYKVPSSIQFSRLVCLANYRYPLVDFICLTGNDQRTIHRAVGSAITCERAAVTSMASLAAFGAVVFLCMRCLAMPKLPNDHRRIRPCHTETIPDQCFAVMYCNGAWHYKVLEAKTGVDGRTDQRTVVNGSLLLLSRYELMTMRALLTAWMQQPFLCPK